jgi:hypothetical protein
MVMVPKAHIKHYNNVLFLFNGLLNELKMI